MNFKRFFTSSSYKGTENYLNTQKSYEIIRTVVYFAISLSLFAAGYFATGTKVNYLTIVAVVGCLPACKSTVQMIMYLRYRSLDPHCVTVIKQVLQDADPMTTVSSLFDLVFTSYDKNFQVGHLAIKGNTIVGFTTDPKFDEKAFDTHIDQILKKDGYKGVSVKVFHDMNKYTERLKQLSALDLECNYTDDMINTLKGVSL